MLKFKVVSWDEVKESGFYMPAGNQMTVHADERVMKPAWVMPFKAEPMLKEAIFYVAKRRNSITRRAYLCKRK